MVGKVVLVGLAVTSLAGCNMLGMGTDVGAKMAKVLGSTPYADCQARFEKGDGDKSGQLTQAEYVATLPTPRPPNEDVGLLFRGMDTDKSGQLTPEEFALSACKPSNTVPK